MNVLFRKPMMYHPILIFVLKARRLECMYFSKILPMNRSFMICVLKNSNVFFVHPKIKNIRLDRMYVLLSGKKKEIQSVYNAS